MKAGMFCCVNHGIIARVQKCLYTIHTIAYSTMFNPIINTILPNWSTGSNYQIASAYEKNIKAWTATIEKLVEAYSEIKD